MFDADNVYAFCHWGRGRKEQSNMVCCQKARKIYYQTMEGSRYLLADERDKKKFLDILFDIEKEEEWLIYAFCLTNECAYFVIEADGAASVRRGILRAANEFLRRYRSDSSHLREREVFLKNAALRELDSLREVAVHCRQIHRLPLEKGYVSRLDDYWWSSYITYAGEYDWKLVDCRIFSLFFSANPGVAKRLLLKFHQ